MTTASRSQFVGATAAGLLVLGFILILGASETSFAGEDSMPYRGNRKMLMTSHATAELPTRSSLPVVHILKSRALQAVLPGPIVQRMAGSNDILEKPTGATAAA